MVAQRAPNWAIWKQLPKRNTYLKAVRIRRSARCRAKNRVTVCNQGWSAPARKYPPICALITSCRLMANVTLNGDMCARLRVPKNWPRSG